MGENLLPNRLDGHLEKLSLIEVAQLNGLLDLGQPAGPMSLS
jgi:hypothetical protein